MGTAAQEGAAAIETAARLETELKQLRKDHIKLGEVRHCTDIDTLHCTQSPALSHACRLVLDACTL